MKVKYKKTILEKIENEIFKVKESDKVIDYILLDKSESAEFMKLINSELNPRLVFSSFNRPIHTMSPDMDYLYSGIRLKVAEIVRMSSNNRS